MLFNFKSRKYKRVHNTIIIYRNCLLNHIGFVEMYINFQKNYYASQLLRHVRFILKQRAYYATGTTGKMSCN